MSKRAAPTGQKRSFQCGRASFRARLCEQHPALSQTSGLLAPMPVNVSPVYTWVENLKNAFPHQLRRLEHKAVDDNGSGPVSGVFVRSELRAQRNLFERSTVLVMGEFITEAGLN